MKIAIEEKRWKSLPEKDLEKIYQIARASSKNEILNLILPKGLFGKELKPYWTLLEKFNSMDLIWVERELTSSSIIDIHKLPELAQAIFLYYNPESSSLENQFSKEDNSEIRLSLKRKLDRTSPRQPEFSGCFDFIKDVTFKMGVKYSYGGWINDDGSLFIKIVPIEKSYLDSREIIPRNNSPEDIINHCCPVNQNNYYFSFAT